MPGLSAPRVSLETQIAAGLRAAWLLGQGREEGLRFTLLSIEGAKRSFWAGAICLLPFLLIRALASGVLLSHSLPVELIGYVLGWVVFPLASLSLADASGRGPLWPVFVAAWNWTNIAQYAALLLATLLGGVLPSTLGGTLTLAAFGYALWMEWFVTKTALRVSGARAVLFVLLDMSIGLFIASIVSRLAS
ncbi:hypothetical protein J8J14_14300 [Roseomonas sp. SSH11]|uniref:Yip1 domain-containing protein n=1 Tax=Pararoseomonas baculiformis TaxID=2820812 RepID=A0ABS4AI90_9PROT|nr:hypothetical protein [Pararoseomonas baculiformis]MBP0445944.1 hypothetical protein [Pararoseomonas baculiformis]